LEHLHIYYNKVDKGGHYAAWEQPQLFSEEIRAGFKSLRSGVAKSAARSEHGPCWLTFREGQPE
jgi:hypothetical protein